MIFKQDKNIDNRIEIIFNHDRPEDIALAKKTIEKLKKTIIKNNQHHQSKEVIEAKKEMVRMIRVYRRSPHFRNGAFLYGSSILGNRQGDSQRYWELKKIIDGSKKEEMQRAEELKKIFIDVFVYVSILYGIYLVLMQDILTSLGMVSILTGIIINKNKKKIFNYFK